MRRITLLTTLFSVMLGSVSAFAQPTEGKFYRIKDNVNTKFLTIENYDANSTGTKGTVPVLDEEQGNPDQVWELKAVDATANQYMLKSKSGYYLKCRAWNCDAVSADGSTITIEATETPDAYYLKNGEKFFKVETVDGVMHPFCDASADNANIVTWSFVEVSAEESFDRVTVTYKYMLDGKEYTTATVEQVKNSEVSVPAQDFLTVVSTEGTIGEEDCEIIVTCAANLPFETAVDAESIEKWYFVKMHFSPGQTRFISLNEDNTIAWVEKVADFDLDPNANNDKYEWGFVGDIYGVKMVNKTDLLSVISSGEGNATMGAFDAATMFQLTLNNSRAEGWFCLKNTEANNYLNGQSSSVKHWTANDEGSSMQVVELADVPTAIQGIAAAKGNNAIYDLSGRRVKAATKGIFIVNGKKVVK